MKKCWIPILHNFSRSTTFVLCKFSFETHILNYLYICKFAQKDFGFIQFLTWFWLKFNWAHVNWSPSHEPTKILCTFLNWNLSSFSFFFLSPLISFIHFDFYLTPSLWINFPPFSFKFSKVQWWCLRVLTPEVSQPTPLKKNLAPRLDDSKLGREVIYLRWS